MPLGIDEIEIAGAVDGATGNVEEAACELLQFRPVSQDRNGRFGRSRRRIAGYCHPCKFALPHLDVVGRVIDRVIEGNLTVAVTMDVAQPYVFRVRDFDRVTERLVAAHDTVDVEVRQSYVAGVLD